MTLLDIAARVVDRRCVTVATFDHGTGRAAESAAALVGRRARALGVACVNGRATESLASEAELRAARWSFLRAVAGGGATIVTAHSADDQIETVLMRVMRDAGARGLAGLAAAGDVARPLLGVGRRAIEAYASERGVEWIEDPTNVLPAYLRNRVRRDLLPAMRRVDPAIDASLRAVGDRAAAWRAEVERLCDRLDGVRVLSGSRLRVSVRALEGDLDLARLCWPALAARVGAVLDHRGMARLAAFTSASRVGARMQLSGGWEVMRGRDSFVLGKRADDSPTPGPFALSDGTRLGDWVFHETPVALTSPRDAWSACLPTDAPLFVRSWRAGDVAALGKDGSRRKVKHVLSAAGVTGHERAGWPVVLAGDDIVWIPGVRRTDAATARSGRPGLAFVCEYDNR